MSNQPFIITISRQYGSGGREIGKKLAEKMGLPFYDRDLIVLAAKASGFSEEIFQEADERATNSLLYSLLMGSYSFGGRLAPINDMPINDKLFLIQADIIKEKAAEGSCIFVGRCADYILRDRPNVLDVFIHADRQSRIDRVINHYAEVDRQNASDFLNKKDKHRSNYYNFYTNQRWGDFSNYQLVLNSSTFGIDNCVSLIQQAAVAMETFHTENKEP